MRSAVATLSAAAVLLTLTACDASDSRPLDQGAAVMCEEFIKKDGRLKAPGSAEFSGVSDTKIKVISDKKPWRYLVTGYVDSQNSFGAMLRNNYSCDISTKDNSNWTLGRLDFTEN